jgi:hypothetical protein
MERVETASTCRLICQAVWHQVRALLRLQKNIRSARIRTGYLTNDSQGTVFLQKCPRLRLEVFSGMEFSIVL